MSVVSDLIVQAPDRSLRLIVETKGKVPASSEWASRMRRNLFAHVALPPAPFFLLALPERFYLWKDARPEAVVPPDYEIDAQEALNPYLKNIPTPLIELSENSLEILVRSWLEDIMSARINPSKEADDWLMKSGLYDAIKHGTIRTRVAA